MRFGVALLVLGMLAGTVAAELPLLTRNGDQAATIDLNLRPRLELDGKDFSRNTGLSDYGNLRTMIGIKVMPNENLLVRLRFKETRLLGTQKSNGQPSAQVEAQEAYFQIGQAFGKPMAVKAGRFEFVLGRNRIFGPGDWNPYGPRTYDGLEITVTPRYGSWSLLAARVLDSNYVTGEFSAVIYDKILDIRGDHDLVVLSGRLIEDHFQPLFSADVNTLRDVDQKEADNDYTAGFYYNRILWERLDFKLDAAYQFGTRSGRDQSAWLLAGDLNCKLPGKLKPWVGGGIDATSGNKLSEDKGSTQNHVFYAPFMTRHVYRGFMDYFYDVQRGLIDAILHAGLKPWQGTQVTVDVHGFWYEMRGVRKGGNGEALYYRQLGQEIDLRAVIPVNPNVDLDGGYSVFLPTEDYKPGGDMSVFGYISAVVTF